MKTHKLLAVAAGIMLGRFLFRRASLAQVGAANLAIGAACIIKSRVG